MEAVTILLADDEAILLLDFKSVLTAAGFLVAAVSSGAKAIEKLKSGDEIVDGVVTDIRFCQPHDGWQVARVAREIDPNMPIATSAGTLPSNGRQTGFQTA